MSGETTTTSLNDYVYSAWIESVYLDYAYDWVVGQQFCRRFSLAGKPSASINLPRMDSLLGTVGVQTAYDTEFNATEGTNLSNTQLTSSYVTGSVSEIALMVTICDNIDEDSVNGLDLVNKAIAQAARVITAAREDDMIALLAGIDTVVGSTGVNLTVANALEAQVGIRRRGWRAPDGVVYILHDQQVDDLEAAIIAASTSMATYAMACDKLLGIDKTVNNGMGNGHVLSFRGYPVYASGVVDTMNTAADRGGGCIVPSSPANDPTATFAKIEKRMFRVEPQRDASMRGTELVFSSREGFFELNGGAGSAIVTDA